MKTTSNIHITSKYQSREQDFRNGAIVYQVLVDRFVQSVNLEEKKDFYAYPKVLKSWNDMPKPGHFMPDVKYWSHELEYFGGDLKSLATKLEYLKTLNIDVLYLNPIFESLSNHKYDATDYLKISAEYGTFEDLESLSNELHQMNMKIILDGVFNHMGVGSTLFKDALNPNSHYRDWFYFGDQYPKGVRLWADVNSLPELNLENPAVKDFLYKKEDSVIRTYLKAGVDGWRLDVAFDLGYQVLRELTDYAHLEKEGSLIVGETWNYPKEWLGVMDGVMNFTLREIIFNSIKGDFSPNRTNQLLNYMVNDSGIDGLLKSWNVLDNHDTDRINHRLPSFEDQMLAQVMQFTFPGSPNLYYGTELGMEGGNDPLNRAPMRWDLNKEDNKVLKWTKSLIDLHQSERSIKVGDYLAIDSEGLIAFERYTDQVSDTILVFINPTNEDVSDIVLVPDSSLMNYSKFKTILGEHVKVEMLAGLLKIRLPKKSFTILKPLTDATESYTPYKRV